MATNEAVELWSKASKQLQHILHPDVYSRWIDVIEATQLDGDQLTLAVDNDFYQTWLEDNYLPLIEKALTSVCGTELSIDFEIRPRRTEPKPQPQPAESLPRKARDFFTRQSREAPRLNPKFMFDTFIVGSSNSFAHAAARAVAQAPARAYNPLFVYGGVGLGKTHLMQAIGHHVLGSSRSKVCYLSSEQLLNEYISHLETRNLIQFRKKYRNTDLLLIDDIHFLGNKERLQEEFFHTFNALFDAHKQIVMTSDRPASEIPGLEQRLVSRFEWGLVTELETPDLETRVAILRKKQNEAQVRLADDLLFFIAENVRSNIRRLEGALIRALSYASLTGNELSLPTLKELLKDTLEIEERRELTFDLIQKAVAEHYDVRLADMTSKRRPRSIAVPRQIAMFLCRRLTRSSLPEIANAFSKTHATVLHACKTIGSRLDVDAELQQDVDHLMDKLRTTAPK